MSDYSLPMNQVFLFYLIRSNLVDLFQSLFYLSKNNLHSYCDVDLVDKFAILNKSNFVLSAESVTKSDFRKISWDQHMPWLSELYRSTGTDFGIGNFDATQIDFLQTQFNDTITISFNYSADSYPALLKNFSEFHIYRLDNGLLPMTEIDLELTHRDDRKMQYMSMFDQQKVLPHSITQPADVCIQLPDLMHIDRVAEYLHAMKIDLSDPARNFYKQWINKNINLFDC